MKVTFNMLFVVLSFVAWMPPLYTPNWLTLILRVFSFGFLLVNTKIKRVIKDPLFWLLLAFTAVQAFSEFRNNQTDRNSMLSSFGYFLVLPSVYLISRQRKFRKYYLRALMVVVGFYLALDLFYIFLAGGTGFNADNQALYFSGGKFQACYVYIVFMALFMLKGNVGLAIKTILMILGMLVALYIDCMTGFLAIACLGATQYIPRPFYIWLAILLAVNYLIVFAQVQTTSPLIRSIITFVLHRNVGLTGRMRVYTDFTRIMSDHWLLGYGYSSSHVAEFTSQGGLYAITNMQNGFLQTVYTSGVVGLVFYMLILVRVFRMLQTISDNELKIVLLGVISAFLIIAVVEIPFSSSTFTLTIGLILLFAYSGRNAGEIQRLKPARLKFKTGHKKRAAR